MKLIDVLPKLNSLEKNSFIKVINDIINNNPKNSKGIEDILDNVSGSLKDADDQIITELLELVKDEFAEFQKQQFVEASSQFDILIDIISRDGNCIMSREWFSRLYENEIKEIKSKIRVFKSYFGEKGKQIDKERLRDYSIYKSCIETAYINDEGNNQDCKITKDEQSILITLAESLELSQEEVKLLNYQVVPINLLDVDDIIKYLKNLGVIFYSKKEHTLYVADEMVPILRSVRGKFIADKFFRRVLKHFKDSQINLISRKHNIDRKLSISEKVDKIIREGISFRNVLLFDIYKDGITKSEKRDYINDFIEKQLKLETKMRGSTAEAKINSLILYFDHLEQDSNVSISVHGYDQLLNDLSVSVKGINASLKERFQLQNENVLDSEYLLAYNIKPMDILYLLDKEEVKEFCVTQSISIRGNEILNILLNYKDVNNLFLENYELIASRDIKGLKDNGLEIKESELGIKFEEITKTIFEDLGFNVDDDLRSQLNDKKNKIDIVLNFRNNQIMIIECKTIKDRDYDKFSSVSRQIKAYIDLAEKKGFRIIKSILVGPTFSDEFEKECGLEYDLNLSLIKASSLSKILEGFKKSKHEQFPYKLLLRDILIHEDRILKALMR
ncbi:MAG: hypothetical protein ACI94Y_000168 [Maribacter sp.]|jgi:hypothetical protein